MGLIGAGKPVGGNQRLMAFLEVISLVIRLHPRFQLYGRTVSPRLIKSLRKHLGISQRELAILTGVTLGGAHQWGTRKFRPKPEKKATLVALRKLGCGEVKKLLEEKSSRTA